MKIELPVRAWNPPIRSTMMSEIDLCPRKFLLSSRYGLRRGYYSEALHMGHLAHILLANLYKGEPEDRGLEECASFIEAEVEHLKEIYLKSDDPVGLLPSGKSIGQTTDKMVKDLQVARVAVHWYNESFPALGPGMECLGTELPVAVKMRDFKSEIEIQVDAVLLLGGSLWTVDHKTVGSSRKVGDRLKKLPYSVQPALYAKAFKMWLDLPKEEGDPLHGYTPENYVGHIHNAIRKPGIRQKIHETWDEYLERVGKWYQTTEQEKGEPAFARSWIKFDVAIRSDPQHDWWDPNWLLKKLNKADFLANIEDPINNLEWFPQNDNACDLPGMLCPYLNNFCSKGADQWPRMAATRFHQDYDPRPQMQNASSV